MLVCVCVVVEESEERRDTGKPQSVPWNCKWILSTGVVYLHYTTLYWDCGV